MRIVIAGTTLLLGAATARAEPPARARPTAARAVESGAVVPLLRAVPDDVATVRLDGGWDTAARQPIADVNLDVRIWKRLRVVGGTLWGQNDGGRLRPYVGGEVTIARGASASLVYRPEGFTEPEGELELGVALARRIGPLAAVGDLTYGQDPEGRERDAEIALGATVHAAPRLWIGGAERMRVALATPPEGEPDWDVAVGPHAAFDAGPVVVLGFAGAVARSLDDDTQTGVAAALGVTRSF